MNAQIIRVAVIGAGRRARDHARVYQGMQQAKLVAITDPDPGAAAKAARQFGGKPYDDYRLMLEVEKPQAVSIATSTDLQAGIAMAALEAGAHVLVEEPLAASLEDGQDLLERARRLDRQLMAGHSARFNPAFQILRDKIQIGALGAVFKYGCRREGPLACQDREHRIALDLVAHDLDLLRFITGRRPLRLYAETGRQAGFPHETQVWALLRYADGAAGFINIDCLDTAEVREVMVVGEAGACMVDERRSGLTFFREHPAGLEAGPADGSKPRSRQRIAISHGRSLQAMIEAFLAALQSGVPVPSGGEEGLESLRLALALFESARTHQVIELEG